MNFPSIRVYKVHRVTGAVGIGREVVVLLGQRVHGEETAGGVHETRMRVIKFTDAEFSLLFLAGEQVIRACCCDVCGGKQLAIGCVVILGKHIAIGIGHSSYTAKVIGDVVVGLPIAVVAYYPAAGYGKTLGDYTVTDYS